MKNTVKRLFLFFLAAVIIATVVQPGSTTNAANVFKQKRITITKRSRQVVDSLGGVKAYYRKGPNDGSNKFYSCAAFVKRYYKKAYGKNVNNLLYNRTPHTSGDSFVRVKTPQIGDIVAMNTGHGTTHWAIVKKVNSKNSITLIEQNWKWSSSGSTQSVVNRKVKTSKVRLYRLKSQKEIIKVSLITD